MLNFELNKIIGLLFTLILSISRVHCELSERDHLKPVVAFKRNVQHANLDPIKLNASSYKDLVTNGKIFVDNSLLLYDFLINPLINIVLSPGKWGKTMNLNMIKTFLQPHVDELGIPAVTSSETDFAYRLFHKAEILRDNGTVEKLVQPLRVATEHPDLLNHYQGKHPVISISFHDVLDQSVDTIEEKYNAAIKRAILEHKYLIIAVRNQSYFRRAFIANSTAQRIHLKMIERMMNDTAGVEEGDLAFLSKALHLLFHTKPFVLIDDYDQPMHSVLQYGNFTRIQCRDIVTMVDRFMSSLFTNNYDIQGAITTGRLQLKHNYWRGYNRRYVAEKDDPWRIYFGFSDLNGRKMYHTFTSCTIRHERMYRWYNRFKATSDLLNYYNPRSFASFMKHDRIDCYNNDSFNDLYIQHLVSNSSSVRANLLKLISKQTVFVETRVPFTSQDMYEMRHTDHLFNTYLFINGYILRHPPYNKFVGKAEVANCEAAFQMAIWLLNCFKRDYNVSDDQLQQVGHHLWNLVNSSTNALTHVEQLEESLTSLYHQCHHRVLSKFLEASNNTSSKLQKYKNQMSIIFYCVSLQTQILSKFDILAYYNNTRQVDVMMTNSLDRYGAAFVLSFHGDSEVNALERAYKCSVMFNKYKRIKFVKFVGVSVSPENQVRITQNTVLNSHIVP